MSHSTSDRTTLNTIDVIIGKLKVVFLPRTTMSPGSRPTGRLTLPATINTNPTTSNSPPMNTNVRPMSPMPSVYPPAVSAHIQPGLARFSRETYDIFPPKRM